METTTEKVYDINERKFVDVSKPVDEGKKDEPPTEKKDAPPADEGKKDEPHIEKTPPPAEEKPDFSAEKAQYETQLTTLNGKVKELEEQVKNPKFEDERQQKAYNFIKGYDPEMWGDGLKTFGTLMTMDTTKISDRDALREEFILSKPNLSREKAGRLFDGDFKSTYELSRDKFESDEDFNEAKELAEIKLNDRGAEARAKLAAKQAEHKAKPVEKAVETKIEEAKAPEASVKSYGEAFDKHMKANETLTFKDDKDEKIAYNIKLSPEVLKNVDALKREYLQRPDIYDKDGKIPNFDAQELFDQFLFLSMGPKAYNKMHFEKIKELSKSLTAEQIAGTVPDKESKSSVNNGPVSIEDQFKALAVKAAKEREGK